MAIYDRRFTLTFTNEAETFEISSVSENTLRVTFDIQHDPGGNNVFGEITVYNLNRNNEQKLRQQFTQITLRAGYVDSEDVIFRGEIINSVPGREIGDKFVTLYCRALGRSAFETDINKTLPRNSSILQVVRECAQAFGVPLIINENDFANDPTFGRGVTLQGDPKVILNNLKTSYDFDWLFENGRLVILKTGLVRQGETVEISMLTGMVASPEVTEIGANVVTKLNPSIRFGTLFRIESITPQVNFSNLFLQNVPPTVGTGEYKVLRVRFRGDTHGDFWDSIIEGIRHVA